MARRTGLRIALIAMALIAPLARTQMFPINLSDSDTKADPNVKLPAYDVASVKENKSGNGMMRIMYKPDGFSCTNISLKTLIGSAYGVRQDLVSGGPGWVESTGFDVEAKVANEDMEVFKKLSQRQKASMLRALLEDRFQLKIHRETKTLPMYDLVVAKGGSKLKAAPPPDPSAEPPKMLDPSKMPPGTKFRGGITMGPGMFKGDAIPMKTVTNELAYIVHSTVIDKTGLAGEFDLDLKWSPDDAAPSGDGSGDVAGSIFTALQEELGLKLQSTKGPTETLVIDHAGMPTVN